MLSLPAVILLPHLFFYPMRYCCCFYFISFHFHLYLIYLPMYLSLFSPCVHCICTRCISLAVYIFLIFHYLRCYWIPSQATERSYRQNIIRILLASISSLYNIPLYNVQVVLLVKTAYGWRYLLQHRYRKRFRRDGNLL